jgi:uncharacterized SAM-binding protein YcdF (DUF218 family)
MISLIKPLITNLLLWIWIAAALFLWWITRENRQFRRYGFCFLALFWIMTTRPVADAVLLPLESAYNPPTISSLKAQGIGQIVVLSGGGGLRTGNDRSQRSDVRCQEETDARRQRSEERGERREERGERREERGESDG